MSNKFIPKILLISVTIFWGCSYFLSKLAYNYVGVMTSISLRFVIGFFLITLFFYKKLKEIDFQLIKKGTYLGFYLFLGILFSSYGVKYTTASNAGFLSCLYIVILPFIYFFIFKKKILKKEIVGSILSFIGIALLSITESFSIHIGDILCIISAFLFSGVIILGDKYSKKHSTLLLGIVQLGSVSILSTIFALFLEDYTIPYKSVGIIYILILALICTAYCYIVQLYSQKFVNAVEAGIILSLEPVFSAIFSFLVLGEILLFRSYIGGFLIMIGALIGGIL